jgi:hypothetical protein
MLKEAQLICMRKKKEYEWQEVEELQERKKIMSDVNIVKKYTRLGDLSTKNFLFKNIRAVLLGYERGILQLWADCYKELLIPLGEGIVPEERSILDCIRILELFPYEKVQL